MYLEENTDQQFDFIWMVKNSVVPRPIAWVSTRSAAGVDNLAPYSYFNLVTMDPPTLMISFIGQKDSYDNIAETGELVVNLVTAALVDPMNASAAILPPDVDEARLLGLATTESTRVRPPRLTDADVALECRYLSENELYGAHVVFAQVIGIHAADRVLDDTGRIRIGPEAYRPVGRLGGALYTTVETDFRIPVPVGSDEWIALQKGSAPVE